MNHELVYVISGIPLLVGPLEKRSTVLIFQLSKLSNESETLYPQGTVSFRAFSDLKVTNLNLNFNNIYLNTHDKYTVART